MAHSSGERFFTRTLYAAVGVMAVIAGVYIYNGMTKLSNAVIKLKRVLFRMPELDTWALDFFFSVENTSDIDLTVTGYVLDMKVNGHHVSTIANKTSQYIAAKGMSVVEVIAVLKPSQLKKESGTLEFIAGLFDYKNMQIDIAGYLSVQHNWMTITNIPVSYSFKLGDMLSSSTPETKASPKK